MMAESTEHMNDIPKIEKRIDVNIAKVGGSEDGSLWVKETLDPFNDAPRRHVGFPDVIIGNSIVQAVRQSVSFTSGATAEDISIFMDTVDTNTLLYENTKFTEGGIEKFPCIIADATNGIAPRQVGGLTIRKGGVGASLGQETTVASYGLPRNYLDGGPCRVLAKGFEITNTTPTLTAGGALAVYRQASTVPYDNPQTATLMNSTTNTTNTAVQARRLSPVPFNKSEVMIIPGAQQWSAKEGCYCVGVMSHQTNDPQDEEISLLMRYSATSGKVWCNTFNSGVIPSVRDTGANQAQEPQLFSPFFLFGAFLSGIPANSTFTIDYVWIIERFPSSNNELVTLSNPSPYYDPVAIELYSKSASHLPHGVKKGANADGDWIKNVADVLSTFGVPGMPLVKGAVDLWNNFSSKKDPAQKVGRIMSPTFTNNSQPKRPVRRRQQPRIAYVPAPRMPPLPAIPRQPMRKKIVVRKRK